MVALHAAGAPQAIAIPTGVFFAILLGLIVPLQAIIVSLFHDLSGIGLLNSLWGLSLAQAAVGLPFGIFMMRSFLLGIPKDLIEADIRLTTTYL